jgi:hypothetical protein
LLYSRRKRLAELAAREARCESFWTVKFDESVRTRLVHSFRSASNFIDYYAHAREAILRDEGKFYLHDSSMAAEKDLISYLMTCQDEMVPTVIEAMSQACDDPRLNQATGNWDRSATFDASVNVILREHRISYELNNSQMIPFSAKELHEEIVAPTLRLLPGRPDLDKVESAYRSALE